MECFGIPRLSPDWSVETRESGVLVISGVFYLKGTQREGPGQ